jgi:transposase
VRKMTRTVQQYSPELRAEAVRLVLEHAMTQADVAKRLSVPKETFANWVAAAKHGRGPVSGAKTAQELENEITRLRKELAEVKQEREVLKNGLRAGRGPVYRNTVGWTVRASDSGRLLFGGLDPVKKPGPGEAADPSVVAPCVTPCRKLIDPSPHPMHPVLIGVRHDEKKKRTQRTADDSRSRGRD